MFKKCDRCDKIKNINNFYKNINCSIDGHVNQCKKCVELQQKEYRKKNEKIINKRSKKYRLLNKEKIRLKDKIYSLSEKGKKTHRKARLKWLFKNPKKNIESKRKWNKNNKDKKREYYLKNKDREIQKNLERRRNSPKLHLRHTVSGLINQRLKKRLSGKNGKSTFSFLPYTIEQLMSHLEKQFKPGMTWGNYGKWHVDHIKPDCLFNYKSVEDKEFQECWSLNNLQPLWAEENFKKNRFY